MKNEKLLVKAVRNLIKDGDLFIIETENTCTLREHNSIMSNIRDEEYKKALHHLKLAATAAYLIKPID